MKKIDLDVFEWGMKYYSAKVGQAYYGDHLYSLKQIVEFSDDGAAYWIVQVKRTEFHEKWVSKVLTVKEARRIIKLAEL